MSIYGDRDGETYDPDEDRNRLDRQMKRVFAVMSDGQWHTPQEIEHRTGDTWASAGARVRDLRKKRFGGYIVERRYLAKGVNMYRVQERTEDAKSL